MSATMETLDIVEMVPGMRYEGTFQPAMRSRGTPGKKSYHPGERWSSSLDPQDLRCLLTVLEESLIPQLLAGYSPAGAAPLESAGRSGP